MINLPYLIEFSDSINKIDMSYFNQFYPDHPTISGTNDSDPYRLLTYLSSIINNTSIIDAGSHHGASALALSYNKSNKVYGFDIGFYGVPWRGFIDNCSLAQRDVFEIEPELIKFTSLINLDIDPHDSEQEIRFFNLLKKCRYRGLLVCDDIHMPNMQKFWDFMPQPKVDITKYGHFSGTGIYCFNKTSTRFILK